MTELVATKVVPPRRRPDLLDRPRLLDALLSNASRRLIVVSAPAGYGKTSLLVDFAHQLHELVCWYTVTESDGDLWAFARYVVGAIRQQIPDFGTRSMRQIDQEPGDQHAVVATLVNEIHALVQPVWLIVDDFHLIEGSQPIRQFLESLIPLLPDNCHLVIATRTVPDLGAELIARLAASREVFGLGHDALRFTPEEAWMFLRDVYHHDITLEEAQELTEASEGWITAIILSGQAGDPLDGIIRARGAGGPLYEYLAAEVLARLPSTMRSFLIESSVLTEMEPEVVDALLDIDNAAAILESLEQQNIFVTHLEDHAGGGNALGESRIWYRYHSLFREFLQARLRAAKPRRYWDLQERAAHVLAEAGYPDQAIDYYLAAGAYEEAAHAIEEQTHGVYTTAQADRVARWIDSLPTELLERHPRLLRYRAKASLERDGDPMRAAHLCDLAERILRGRHTPMELAWVLLDKAAALRIQGQLKAVIDNCNEALELMPYEDPALVAEAQRNLGLARAEMGQLEEGVSGLRIALDLWQQSGNHYNCAVLHNDLGHVLHRLGNLTASDLHFRKSLEIWEGLDDVSRAVLTLNNLAVIYHDQGKFRRALKEYQHAVDRAREAASRRYGAYALIGTGDVYRDLGRYTDAVEVYKQGLLDARKVGDAFLGTYGLDALGQTYHLMGRTSDGIALVRRAYEDARERGAEYEVARYQLSLGAIAHEQGFLDEAIYRLIQCAEHFQSGHVPELAKTNLHLAQAYHLAYRSQEMRECIRGAELCLFRLGYDGFILSTLLRTAGAIYAAGDTSPYLRDLLQKAEDRLGPISAVASRPPSPPLRVQVLGQARVHLGDVPLVNDYWSRQRVQELFFYLLMRPNRTTHQIGVDLWPDLPPKRVRNNLYVTVSRLRQALGNQDYVVSKEGRYSLRVSQLWVDAQQFRDAIQLAQSSPDIQGEIHHLERAVGLYKGGFLAGFPATIDSGWIREEQEDLQRLYRRALARLIDYWTSEGDEQRVRRYTQHHSNVAGW
ncbi:MAG: tetratricopeptide repeat protein [Anaerolineae bacterium]